VQFASFDLGDPLFDVFGLRLSAQLVTLENLYGLDPARTEVVRERDAVLVRADGLAWAGQQQQARLLIRDLDPRLAVVEGEGKPREVTAWGEVLTYPTRLPTAAVVLRSGGRNLGARAEDPQVREKRFAVSVERLGPLAGRGLLELIHEETASQFSSELEAPPFIVAIDPEPRAFEAEQVAFAERAFGLLPWSERPDVPAWAREIRLVATLHGMHWTGRVFLDYEAMLSTLRFVAERIEGRRVLAYLPGWEGRYYWRYGDYRPEPRLGGERGFAALCEGARGLGVHLMPMFGAHCANATLARFRDFSPDVHMKSATGRRFHGNTPDWDLSRSHDPGWQAWLNPGHPDWRNTLAEQIESLARSYGFDAVFLDTTEVWTNDADHPVYVGLCGLVERLRARLPEVLLAAEYDYDALLALFPLFQRAWWIPAPAWTARYAMRFGHLCEGEPEGRTGVHELGSYRPGPVPAAPGLLPTLAFDDGTLLRSRDAVEAALAAAVRDGC
jgi:hypothetical protein